MSPKLNRRGFGRLMGAAIAGEATTHLASAPQMAVPEEITGSPALAKLFSHLMARIEELERKVEVLSGPQQGLPIPFLSTEHSSPPLASSSGNTLHVVEDFGANAAQYIPPLDTSVKWSRRTDNPGILNHTYEILTLTQEFNASQGYPYTLASFLRTLHTSGGGVANFAALRNYGTSGAPWATALHAETYHGSNNGTSIGANIEVHRGENLNTTPVQGPFPLTPASTGRVIGVNIQGIGHNGYSTSLDEAINIQCGSDAQTPGVKGSWYTGLHFDPSSQGTRAIWIEGNWGVGLDTHNSSIRMNAGSRIYLEATQQIYLTYNPTTLRIEFHNGNNVVGYIPINAAAHAL